MTQSHCVGPVLSDPLTTVASGTARSRHTFRRLATSASFPAFYLSDDATQIVWQFHVRRVAALAERGNQLLRYEAMPIGRDEPVATDGINELAKKTDQSVGAGRYLSSNSPF